MEDENNLDALIQFAFLNHLPDALNVLRRAERQGREALKRRLGQDCLDDGSECVGNFYTMIVTRPYMRVLQAQVRLYFENKQYQESADTIVEMLRLCPGDNMGQRTWLSSILLLCNRPGNTLSFCQKWLAPDRPSVFPRGGVTFEPPSSVCFKPEEEERISKYGNGAMAYNAAVSAFKVFGDCDVARQYLRIAAKVNPIILVKILANIDKPRGFNNMPRTLNGSEDAQDYLFLTQDVWMADDVWTWANSTAEAKNSVLKPCANSECGAVETKVAQFKRCAACKQVAYCSQACQKNGWKAHKPRCQEYQQIKSTIRAVYAGRAPPADAMPTMSADIVNGGVALQTHIDFN
ncbi:hypothetical protein ID866_4326 [Astraeus odoratus]|nr:hypothetical protein ID866_4326 [Astraeus odoratus]